MIYDAESRCASYVLTNPGSTNSVILSRDRPSGYYQARPGRLVGHQSVSSNTPASVNGTAHGSETLDLCLSCERFDRPSGGIKATLQSDTAAGAYGARTAICAVTIQADQQSSYP